MSDPLLTSLCGICHIRKPQYRCPRCDVRTCSLPCIKKHKNWASCSGERDPTVFIPASQLRTEKGIDHDYNFLTKIERAVELVDKIITDERKIMPQRQLPQPLHGHSSKRSRLGKGRSRGQVTTSSAAGAAEGAKRWPREAIRRLRELDINLISLPFGMARAKENDSNFHHKSATIHWRVEWLICDPADQDGASQPTSILGRSFDNQPVSEAFTRCTELHNLLQLDRTVKRRIKRHRKKMRIQENRDETDDVSGETHLEQDAGTAPSATTPPIMQDGRSRTGTEPRPETVYKFFLQVPRTPSREAKRLIPVEATATLADLLSGRDILEFPTIFALPAHCALPKSYVIEDNPARRPKPHTTSLAPGEQPKSTEAKKRKRGALDMYASSEEEGEIVDGVAEEGNDASEGEDEKVDGEADDGNTSGEEEGETVDGAADEANTSSEEEGEIIDGATEEGSDAGVGLDDGVVEESESPTSRSGSDHEAEADD